VKEEVDSEDGKLWKEAMVDEMTSLHKNACITSLFSCFGKKLKKLWLHQVFLLISLQFPQNSAPSYKFASNSANRASISSNSGKNCQID